MEPLLEFARPYAIVFGVAIVLFFVVRPIVGAAVTRSVRWSADRIVRVVRRSRPVGGVVDGANAWSCGRCRSVNRPDADVCYSCRRGRSEVEHLQGQI